MTPGTLGIVGASVRAAAQSAARAGWAIQAADLFADRDLSEIAEARRVVDYPAGLGEHLPGVDSWMYTGALENEPDCIEAWSRRARLLGNSAETLRVVRDPIRWTAALAQAGLPAPRVAYELAAHESSNAWLVKPLRSAFGRSVRLADSGERMAPPGCFFQQRIEGRSVAGQFASVAGRARLLGVVAHLAGPSPRFAFSPMGAVGPLLLTSGERRAWEAIGQTLATAFPLRGLWGVDAIVRGADIWPVEINPRYTASMELLERASGTSLVGVHIDACVSDRLPPEGFGQNDGPLFGKAILFAPAAGTIRPDDVEWLQGPDIADLPAMDGNFSEGDPVCTVFSAGDSAHAVERDLRDRLQAAANRLHWRAGTP